MEENILSCLENFDILWQRVSPGVQLPPTPVYRASDCCGELAELWKKSAELCDRYCRLAGQFRGKDRHCLLRKAQENKQQARRLKGEYFLRRGECPAPIAADGSFAGKLQQLRKLFEEEKKLAKALARAADAADEPDFAHCLSAFSRTADHRAEENRKLLLRCFC